MLIHAHARTCTHTHTANPLPHFGSLLSLYHFLTPFMVSDLWGLCELREGRGFDTFSTTVFPGPRPEPGKHSVLNKLWENERNMSRAPAQTLTPSCILSHMPRGHTPHMRSHSQSHHACRQDPSTPRPQAATHTATGAPHKLRPAHAQEAMGMHPDGAALTSWVLLACGLFPTLCGPLPTLTLDLPHTPDL